LYFYGITTSEDKIEICETEGMKFKVQFHIWYSYAAEHNTSLLCKRAVPQACTEGWYAARTLTTSLTTSTIES
jgi:hypothetical protein